MQCGIPSILHCNAYKDSVSLFRKHISKYEDQELLQFYKTEQKQKYVSELYGRYAHLVMGVSLKYLKNQPEAADMTADVYEILVKKLLIHEVDNFSGWLYQLTKNQCLMLLRKNKRVELVPLSQKEEAPDENELDTKKVLEVKLDHLTSEIEKLKPAQSHCIKLFYIKKLSYKEIVAQTKYSEKEVKSYIQNGKRNLKNQLMNYAEFKTEERNTRTA